MKTESVILDKPLALEMGGFLSAPRVTFTTYGHLNAQKDNVILACHALTANSEVHDWWSGLYGKNKVFDPEEYFIICINNLGSPYGTSSPKTINSDGRRYGLEFPPYTLRDTAVLHQRLLEYLELDRIELMIGGSCGGNIAQEIAYIMGDAVQNMVLLCCSAVETPWVIGIHESQRVVLESDSSFYSEEEQAGKQGLKGARSFALPFYRSHISFKIRQSEEDDSKMESFKASSYIRYQGQKFINRYDAHCYYKQLNALDTHNMGRGRSGFQNALSQINAKTLCIGFDTDLLIPPIEVRTLAQHIPNAEYCEIETPFGHDAFLIETELIQHSIDQWK